MENIETPTNMTTGVAVPVNNNPSFGSEPEEGTIIEQVRQDENTVVPDEVQEIGEIAKENESVNISDLLLKTAKEEGFEQALVALANNELDEKMPEDAQPQADEDNSEFEKKNDEVVDEKEEKEVEPVELTVEEEREQLIARVNSLEEQVGELMEETKELSERLKSAEAMAQLSKEMMLQMLALLYEMIKKEEDEKDKVSLLETLIALIGKFMMTLVDPEGEDKKEEKKVQPEPEKKGTVTPDMKKVMQLLKKGTAKSQASKLPPRAEKMEASTEVSLAA
jgi:hypothetical protein